ncbi:TRAP transporter large permease [Pseudalkalibacillus caeni]|uniref:TRAP transporter large permease n=1 Tax=Exobacillus caeni TaxID=2574798 RepID=A0A5R9F7C2_9BACL|nr:TRAP transporter large permease [Pseudalkalibacillus caeni]TLS38429.1 TRAP transporter large permease [Pseudalkalibacillus caeni]
MIPVVIISLLVLFALSVPIAISLGITSTIAVSYTGMPLLVVIQRMFGAIDLFPLMAIPFFILAGNLMEAGGISKRLVNFANSLVGGLSGGLAAVAVVTSMFFAAISGSGPATVAAIGSILIPAMIAKGYDRNFAGAVQSVSGELGVIIPPSIPLILYGVTAEVSIGTLFIAGVIPGLFIAGSLLLTVFVLSKKKGYQGTPNITNADRIKAFKDAILALLMPGIILGGIYGGIFTPTEAAGVAVVYAFIVGFFVYRELKFKNLIDVFARSAITTSIIMIIISTAGLFGWILTRERIPQKIAESFMQFTDSPIVFLLLINVLLWIVGMFFETASSIIILAPILTPIAVMVGVDPVHFGIIMVVNLAMGMVTPPLGVNLFVSVQIANTTLERITKAILPFLFVVIVDILIISYLPQLSMWLPSLMDK